MIDKWSEEFNKTFSVWREESTPWPGRDELRSLDEWNAMLVHKLLFNTVLLWIYCVVGVIGNSVVLFFYTFRIKGKLEDRFLIPHLAFFDLLATVFTTVDKTLDNVFPVTYPNYLLCQFSNFTSRVFAATGDGILLLIAFQRYHRICRPFQFQRPLPNDRICVILMFAAAIVLNSPVFLFYELHQVHLEANDSDIVGYRCDHIHHHKQFNDLMTGYDVIVFVLIVVVMVIISVLYILIARAIKDSAIKTSKNRKQSIDVISANADYVTSDPSECWVKSTADDQTKISERSIRRNNSSAISLGRWATLTTTLRNRYQTNRFSYMFMTIALLFIVTYIPSNVLKICELHHPDMWTELSHWKLHTYLFFRQVYILNHVVNPFIYGLFDSGFRRNLILFFRCSKN